ncbi:MAG: ABC transporter permease [SAR202 cluster bacterium]|nr:ABC transporter permease [SAR202 cluster bacterium]
MIEFLIRRAIYAVFTIFTISILAFLVVQLPPGDFVSQYILLVIGPDVANSEAAQNIAESLRAQYGLDQPVFIQYFKWLWLVLQGHFGISLEYKRPVMEIVREHMLLTTILAFATVLLTWSLAVPIGIYSAVRQHSIGDYVATFVGFFGLAVPDFLLALALLWIGYFYFDMSVGGLFSAHYINAPWSMGRVVDLLSHMWIPAIVLGTSGTAGLIRIMRANLLDELRKPYVLTARAKGMSEIKLILKYPVRVALNPVVSTVGYVLPFLLSGSVIVSVVLSLPTVGPLLLRALRTEDMFMASTIVLLLGTLTVIGTFISDVLLVLLDPRIRLVK